MHKTIPDSVVDALLSLLAEKAWEDISLSEIAGRAGLGLADLREAADGKLAIIAAFQRRIDRAVLEDVGAGEEDGDSHRDRLFDIAMRRFDRLMPHRRALAHLAKSAARDPVLAVALNALSLVSARYMLTAAGLSSNGVRGIARAQGLIVILARVGTVWSEDGDPDQSRTMAALDKALDRAETWDRRAGRVADRACRVARRFGGRRSRAAQAPRAEAASAG